MVLTPSSPPAHIRCVGPVCYNALSDKVYYNGSNGKINGPQVKLQTVAVVGVVGAVATIGAVKAHQTLKATRNTQQGGSSGALGQCCQSIFTGRIQAMRSLESLGIPTPR
mmetsp:Transcript_22642/g.27338  ORF Transcript_22642/g.27338 Transcript_22642/m.27338 type:complete len:110 (-) Transcript_22642:254-583(-)